MDENEFCYLMYPSDIVNIVLTDYFTGLRDALYGIIWQCLKGAFKPDVATAALADVSVSYSPIGFKKPNHPKICFFNIE